MSRYPDAVWRPVARYQPGGRVAQKMTARRVCLHTAVSNGSSLYPYFSRDGNPVAHFYVDKEGRVEQYIDTGYKSTANLYGNHDIISVESWDGAGVLWDSRTSNVPPWNDAQVNALVKLLAWISDEHKIPLVALPDSKTGRNGVGWHRQGCDPYRAAGGEKWSLAYGKVCPGDKRIAQIPSILREASEFDMALTPEQINEIAAAVWAHDGIPNDSGNVANPVIQAKSALARLLTRSRDSAPKVDQVLQKLDALLAAEPPVEVIETVVVTTGKPLPTVDIARVARAAGFTDSSVLVVAVAVALAESNGYEKAVGGPNQGEGPAQYSYDFGLWQINGFWHNPTDAQKFVGAENAKMAFKIYTDRGNSFTPWSVYNSGSYLKRLSEAQAAVAELNKGS